MIESLSDRLTQRLTPNILLPIAMFWLVGVAALFLHGSSNPWGVGLASFIPGEPQALKELVREVGEFSILGQLALILIVVIPSAYISEFFILPILQLLEGYWPASLEKLEGHLIDKKRKRVDEAKHRRNELLKNVANLWPSQRKELGRLDCELETETPGANLMPTQLGNILRAAETRPTDKYGLNIVVCWPRIWLFISDGARVQMVEARASLDDGARMFFWGFMLLFWVVWAWWALPLAAVMMFLAYRAMVASARAYGSLLESAFDVYRLELYDKVGWPKPDPEREVADGRLLSSYLYLRPLAPGNQAEKRLAEEVASKDAPSQQADGDLKMATLRVEIAKLQAMLAERELRALRGQASEIEEPKELTALVGHEETSCAAHEE